MLEKINNFIFNLEPKVKNFINSIRIPRLLDFFIKLDAKDPTAPTLEESLKDAPPSINNWERLGLGWVSRIGSKVWVLFAIAIAVFLIYFFSETIINVFRFLVQFGVVLLITVPLYYIWKKFKG